MRFPSRTLLALVVVLAGAIMLGGPAQPGLAQYTGPVVTQASYGPGGREVAFWTTWRGKPEIWAVSTLDGRLRFITEGMDPVWSPTGSWIAFVSPRGDTFNIWLVRPDGTGLTPLTRSATSRSRQVQPAWSPDGGQVVFASDGIWTINMDGSGLRRVINPSPPRARKRPSFSPDGKQLVFSEEVCSKVGAGSMCTGDRLVIMNGDGTGLRYLTSDGFSDVYPSWGRRGILFYSGRRLGSPGIKLIQPDGSGLQAIPNVVGIKPVWSPDGNKFAFEAGASISEFDFLTGAIRTLVEITGFFVPMDIMPNVSPKIISIRETSLIRVAILPAPGFDPVHELDQTSLSFGRTGDEESLDSCRVDGRNVVCQFKTALTGFRPGDVTGILRAIGFEGRGSIQVVP